MNPAMNPITEDDIADFLVNTPDFFERHAELLSTVQLTSPHGKRAVSLQERQAEMLREKIKGLELRGAEMIRHGNENMRIADKLQRWTRSLLSISNAQDLPAHLVQEVQDQFVVPQAAVKMWGVAPQYAAMPFASGASEDVKTFASSLAAPFCGANVSFEAANWLVDPAAAKSLALIALRTEGSPQAVGLLVLASPDAERFNERMGTDFLERMGELASAALSRLRP